MSETVEERWLRMHAAGMVRWMPGMRGTHRWISGFRVLCDEDGESAEEYVVRPGPDGNQIEVIHECGVMGMFPNGDGSAYPFVPDFDDPATLGCLLTMAREAWGCDQYRILTVEPAGEGWCVCLRNGRHRPPSRARAGWDLDRPAHGFYRADHALLGVHEFASEAEALLDAIERAKGAER